jgi:hypothetical protein
VVKPGSLGSLTQQAWAGCRDRIMRELGDFIKDKSKFLKKSHNSKNHGFFSLFLLGNVRIWIRIREAHNLQIRILNTDWEDGANLHYSVP